MARDRFDDADDFDDRPRRRDDDYDRDDGSDDRRRGRRVDLAAARSKVAAPGILLALVGGAATLLFGAVIVYSVVNPVAVVELTFDKFSLPLLESQPPSPQRDAQIDDLKAKRAEALAAAQNGPDPLGVGLNLLMLIPSVLVLVGGLKMRSLSGYGLAMTGAIFALIPCSNMLICLAMPFGLWALIVLLQADVKAAFRANRGRPQLDGGA